LGQGFGGCVAKPGQWRVFPIWWGLGVTTFIPGESCLRYRPLYTLILAAALDNPLQFSRQLTITNFLLNLAKVAYATVLYLTLPDPTRNIVYCEVWQALTNTGPIHESWKPMVQDTTLFRVQTFPEDAFCVARRLVLVVYKIRDKSQAIDREELVKQLLTTVHEAFPSGHHCKQLDGVCYLYHC
jgi:hypothetical protein